MVTRRVKLEPRYDMRCDVCGQSPVVTFVYEDTGEFESSTEMCGPCTFGEAKCIDPEEWGEVVNDKNAI